LHIIRHHFLTCQLNASLYLSAQEPIYSDPYHIERSSSQRKTDEHRPAWEILVLSEIICRESSVE